MTEDQAQKRRTVRYEGPKGKARASYHPEWSKSRPWASYINGTAGQQFSTLESAEAHFLRLGFKPIPITI